MTFDPSNPHTEDSAFRRILNSAANKLGALIGIVIVTAIFGAQCVWSFVRGNPSETYTCDSQEVRNFCDDPGTIANFFVAVCGREEVEFKGTLFRTITLGERDIDPDTLAFGVQCGDTTFLTFEALENEELELDEFSDIRRYLAGDRDHAVLDIYEDWAESDIDTAEARRRLLSLR